MPNNGKADLAREYRKKHGSTMATKKLARIMYDENKLIFTDVEDARTRLRYIEGKQGKPQAKSVKSSEFYREEARPYNPYSLPESDETEYAPYNLKAERVLALYDVHIPFHSVPALTAAIDYGKKEKVDCVFLGGDILDCFKLSRWVK